MNWQQITLLAIIQGLTEFLPISSSGHLVIVEALLHIENADLIEVNVFLHAGTLGSILIFYRREILRMLTRDRRVLWLLAVGTLPAAVVGLVVDQFFEQYLKMPLLAGLMLPVTGLMLLWVGRRDGKEDYARLTYRQAFVIGLFQAFALLPGISRSGSTIVGGLLVGLRRPEAATFAFLLAIPAIALAAGWKMLKLVLSGGSSTSAGVLALGAIVALVVGLAALWCLVRVINRGRLHWFAFWCIPVGVAVVVWQVLEWVARL